MQGLKPFLLPGLAAIVLIALLLVRTCADAPPEARSDPSSERPSPRPASSRRSAAPAAEPAAAPTEAPRDPPATSPTPPPTPPSIPPSIPDTRPDSPEKDARDALHAQITAALAEGGRNQRLPTDYVRARMTGELSRVANRCAAQAPGGGRAGGAPVSMQITILGAAQVGGVLEAVAVAPTSAQKHAGLVRCLTHGLLNATLPAPPTSGAVTMVYPFTVQAAGPR